MPSPGITPLELWPALVFWLIVFYRWSREPEHPLPSAGRPHYTDLRSPPLVSIIVPARNEAHQIAECVRSLLAQDYPRFEVIVVDDCSEDGTGAIVGELSKRDSRLTLVCGTPVPEGWMGKSYAISQGYQRAQGQWLLFTDADTSHATHLLSAVLAHVLERQAGFATVIGDQRHPTFGVYLANLPVFTYIFMAIDPKGWNNAKSRQSLVNGQYLLFSREAYEAIGTHAAVRHYSSTDVSLGYLAKMDGWLPLLIDGRGALRTTMYRSLREAFQGWARSLVNGIWSALGPGVGSVLLILMTAGLCLFWIAPWIAWVQSLVRSDTTGVFVSSLQIAAGITLLRFARGRWTQAIADGIVMPFSFVLFTAMVCAGLAQAGLRGGTLWKKRIVRTGARLPRWNPKPTRTLQQTVPDR